MLVWLCVWREVQIVCIWSSRCHRIPKPRHLLSPLNPGWFYLSGTGLPRLSWKKRHNSSSNTHTHPFNGPLSKTTWVSWYQNGTTNLDFTEARDSEWQWHQLGYMQVCISLQTDNHASTPPLSFLQARCPSCRPTNSVKALKAQVVVLLVLVLVVEVILAHI